MLNYPHPSYLNLLIYATIVQQCLLWCEYHSQNANQRHWLHPKVWCIKKNWDFVNTHHYKKKKKQWEIDSDIIYWLSMYTSSAWSSSWFSSSSSSSCLCFGSIMLSLYEMTNKSHVVTTTIIIKIWSVLIVTVFIHGQQLYNGRRVDGSSVNLRKTSVFLMNYEPQRKKK